ncbi:MAG TPA: signal peptide peptidase SppA [Kofleriaceae bacterium]|nr:signal peptide peptidase SppA [Kofleriaceae bacterium]
MATAPTAQPPSPNPLGILSLLADRADEPGPYDEPRQSRGYDSGEPHGAVIELDQPIVELRSIGLLGGSGVEMRELGDELRRLARDRSVTALVIRFGGAGIDMPAAEELRAALDRFRAAPPGRKIHCHTDSAADSVTYYAMSACDSIGLAAGGELVIAGAAAVPIHVKGALDRLGIQADFLHVGAFKGAAEPLTRDRPSPEMLETLGAILDERFAALVDGIAKGRRLPPARVRELIDRAVFPAEEALAARLVDQVAGFDGYRDQVLDGGEWVRARVGQDEQPGLGQLMQFLGVAPAPRPTRPHLALVYAVGSVVDGEGGGRAAARREIAPRVLGPALRALAADDSVKAVVLRVDSGGGSALASETLWQALSELRKRKPVVVSMAGVAASGGYYIGCAANQIFASRTTLTGSIGVVGGKLAVGGALGKLGITGHPIGRGKRALMWSPMSRWTRDERAAVQVLMQSIYDAFVARVAEGRRKPADQVQAVAQGRVWTGAAAAQRGLVDRIGGLDDAIAAARKLASLDDTAPLEVYPPPPSLADLLGGLGASSMPFGLDTAAAEAAASLAPREAAAVLGLYHQLAGFASSPVQAALLLPLILR